MGKSIQEITVRARDSRYEFVTYAWSDLSEKEQAYLILMTNGLFEQADQYALTNFNEDYNQARLYNFLDHWQRENPQVFSWFEILNHSEVQRLILNTVGAYTITQAIAEDATIAE
jgi:hypothetical protein